MAEGGFGGMRTPRSTLFAGALLITGCAVTSEPRCIANQTLAIHDTLYFGTDKPSGVVSAQEWAQFVDAEITPRFPKGLTVAHVDGQWQSADGSIVREPSNVLEVIHPADAASETAVRAIIDTYKTQFQQEAVLWIRAESCVSFE